MERIITAMVALLALNHLLYAIQNLFNLNQAYRFVAAVLSQDERPLYPRSIMPPVRRPVLVWAGLFIIIAAEGAAGLTLAWGALSMFAASGTSAAAFARASEWAILGCGMALAIWFGVFLTLGAALFQMWQTPSGQAAMGDAFRNGVFTGLVLLLMV